MDVVRDVLDQLLIDREGRELGRIDGILMDHTQGGPPRLAAVLMGASVLGSRLHPIVGRCVSALERWFGWSRQRLVRVDFEHLRPIGHEFEIDLGTSADEAQQVERSLRVWLMKVPGA